MMVICKYKERERAKEKGRDDSLLTKKDVKVP